MGKTVFILGAGASAEAGAPVMKGFLDKAEELYMTKKIHEADDREAFEAVFDGIYRLQSVFAKSSLDTNNLESVFVAFEMAELLGRLGELDDRDKLKKLPDQLRRVIVRTLEQTVLYPVSGGGVQPHRAYLEFAKAIKDRNASVITFNYDLALEYAMASLNMWPKYHVGANSSGDYDVLKLHGSLNWYKDGDGLKAQSVRMVPASAFHMVRVGQEVPLKATGLHPSSEETDGEPMIVPPTQSKGDHHRKLRPVWCKAAELLQSAEEIHVIGFSLPPTDEFFRYLFALGTVGRTSAATGGAIQTAVATIDDRHAEEKRDGGGEEGRDSICRAKADVDPPVPVSEYEPCSPVSRGAVAWDSPLGAPCPHWRCSTRG